jgi:hypothetical protein
LTFVKISRISPRHDHRHQTQRENRKARPGFGRRARVRLSDRII